MKRFATCRYAAAIQWIGVCGTGLLLMTQAGCHVPQKPGNGLVKQMREPDTDTKYYLYLPEDYVKNNGRHPEGERWPMVVTFHGLRPYDSSHPQIREWQEEADRYGFVVVAPELRTCDSLTMPLPVSDPTAWYVQKDEKAVIAIMDEVMRRTNADPNRVLATSFSSGGYLAHYMVNRYPERFSCLAVRGSNFNAQLLSSSQIPRYRNMQIGIFFGENDLGICREESLEAIRWYRRHRFNVVARKVAGLGHERTPQTAAALFAATIGATPKTPPDLGNMVVQDIGTIPTTASMSQTSPSRPPSAPSTRTKRRGSSKPQSSTADRATPVQPSRPSPSYAQSNSRSESSTRSQRNMVFSPPTPAGRSIYDEPQPAPVEPIKPVRVQPKRSAPRAASTVPTQPRNSATPKRRTLQPYSDTAQVESSTGGPGAQSDASTMDRAPQVNENRESGQDQSYQPSRLPASERDGSHVTLPTPPPQRSIPQPAIPQPDRERETKPQPTLPGSIDPAPSAPRAVPAEPILPHPKQTSPRPRGRFQSNSDQPNLTGAQQAAYMPSRPASVASPSPRTNGSQAALTSARPTQARAYQPSRPSPTASASSSTNEPARAKITTGPQIRVDGGTVGRVPMWVDLSLDMPDSMRRGASVLWTNNGMPFANSQLRARSVLRQAGQHKIEAHITTADNRKLVLKKTLTALPATDTPSGS